MRLDIVKCKSCENTTTHWTDECLRCRKAKNIKTEFRVKRRENKPTQKKVKNGLGF